MTWLKLEYVVESTVTVNCSEHETRNIVYSCNENSKSSQLLILFCHAFSLTPKLEYQ